MSKLERAEAQMKKAWHDLALAEERGIIKPVLERMYLRYENALEEYLRSYQEVAKGIAS